MANSAEHYQIDRGYSEVNLAEDTRVLLEGIFNPMECVRQDFEDY